MSVYVRMYVSMYWLVGGQFAFTNYQIAYSSLNTHTVVASAIRLEPF